MEELLQDIKDVQVKKNDIRFLFGILAAIGVFITIRLVDSADRQNYFILIAGITLLGFILPKQFTPLYRVWMAVSICIGFVMSSILFTVIFFIGFTPIGFLMKVFHQQPLDLSWKSDSKSYWEKRKKTSSTYEKQY